MQLTIQPSQNQLTKNTQIGNVTVEQITTTLGSDPDHVVEAL